MDVYRDPWQEYRAIIDRVRKRFFMRKPNFSHASEELAKLGQRFQDEECVPYAALCQLAIGRVQRQTGNGPAEVDALEKAARLFADAEFGKVKLGLPGFHENLTSAIHCYGHAIKSLVDTKHHTLAGGLCIEVGVKLYKLDRADEAIEHFERGARLLDGEPNSKQYALGRLAQCQADCGFLTHSLASIDELWTYTLKLYGETADGTPAEILKQCEMSTIMLLMNIRALPHQMNGRQSHLLDMYSSVSLPTEPLPQTSALDENEFLLMQSFVISVLHWRDAHSADLAFGQILPFANELVCDLGMILIERLYNDDYRDR